MLSYLNDRSPYLYVIGWTTHDKWYLGCRYGKGCKPSDLWTTYFTSSQAVTSFRAEHGKPDHVEVLFTGDMTAIYRAEQQAIVDYRLTQDLRWLNKGVQLQSWAQAHGALSEEARATMLQNMRKPKSEAGRVSIRDGARKRSKLSEKQVLAIYAAEGPKRKIADAFGVHYTTVTCIKEGRTCSHITGHVRP